MKLTRKQYILGGVVAVAVAASGAFILFRQSAKPTKAVVITQSTDKPSEEKPGKDYKWSGGPEDPKKIIISKVGVDSYVQQVGVDQNNQVAVPNNLFMVGWFVKTVQPGKPGLSVIDGHVTNRKNLGVFNDLNKLVKGDRYTVLQGSGKKLTYEVIDMQTLPADKSVAVIFSQDPSVKSQLNLVTCAGIFNEQTRQYPDRLVVAAKLVD